MYKKFVFIFIAALMGACTSRQQADEKTLYVSILPLRSLVGEIVGDDFKIEVLVPPGASPETFEPTPRQFIGLNRAEMIFNVGLIDFETTLLAKPVIGTMLPAPAYLPILSYTPSPVSSDDAKIRQMLVAVEALCAPHFSP